MSQRIGLLVIIASAAFSPAKLQAGEALPPPAIVVRVQSIDAIVDNFKLLASIAGSDEAAKQIESLIKTQVGDTGLAGIDLAKPFGAYARLGEKPDDVTGAVLVPVADEKAFVGMLEGLNFKIKKEADGLIVLKTKTPFDGYVRFAKGYAYVTAFNKASLDEKNLVPPSEILAGKADSTVSAKVRLDLLPKQAKQLALAQIEQELQKAQENKQPGETATQKAFRVACLQEITKCIDQILKEGKEVALNLELSKEKFNLTITLSGQPATELTKALAKMGEEPSLFAGLKTKNAAFTGALHMVLPESVDAALGKVVDEAMAQAKKSLQDPAKKKQAEELLEALAPTLKGGVVDAHASLIAGKSGQFAVLVAVKVKAGDKLGKTVHALIADALKGLPEASRAKIKLDFDKVGAISIHRFELPADQVKEKSAAELFGEPYLYVAFHADAVFVAVGRDGLGILKAVVAANTRGPGPVVLADFDLARFANLLPDSLPEQAKKLFKKEGDGRFRLSLEGGSAMTIRVETRPAALQFLLQMSQKKAE